MTTAVQTLGNGSKPDPAAHPPSSAPRTLLPSPGRENKLPANSSCCRPQSTQGQPSAPVSAASAVGFLSASSLAPEQSRPLGRVIGSLQARVIVALKEILQFPTLLPRPWLTERTWDLDLQTGAFSLLPRAVTVPPCSLRRGIPLALPDCRFPAKRGAL